MSLVACSAPYCYELARCNKFRNSRFFYSHSPWRAAMARHATANGRKAAPPGQSASATSAPSTPSSRRSRSSSKPGHSVEPAMRLTAKPSPFASTPSMCWYTVSRICPTPEISMRRAFLFSGAKSRQNTPAPALAQAPASDRWNNPVLSKKPAATARPPIATSKTRKRTDGRTTTLSAIDMTGGVASGAPATCRANSGAGERQHRISAHPV